MSELGLAYICTTAIVGIVAIVAILSEQWVRLRAGRWGVGVESRPHVEEGAGEER